MLNIDRLHLNYMLRALLMSDTRQERGEHTEQYFMSVALRHAHSSNVLEASAFTWT